MTHRFFIQICSSGTALDCTWRFFLLLVLNNCTQSFSGDVCDAEVNKPTVPLSCCRKNQYGKYRNTKKCQTWHLGPPYQQSGPKNEAVFYKVFIFSYNNLRVCIPCSEKGPLIFLHLYQLSPSKQYLAYSYPRTHVTKKYKNADVIVYNDSRCGFEHRR